MMISPFMHEWVKDHQPDADERKKSVAGAMLLPFGNTDHAQWGMYTVCRLISL